MLLDESYGFLCESLAHDTDFNIHFALVGTRVHENGTWLRVGDDFLDQV